MKYTRKLFQDKAMRGSTKHSSNAVSGKIRLAKPSAKRLQTQSKNVYHMAMLIELMYSYKQYERCHRYISEKIMKNCHIT